MKPAETYAFQTYRRYHIENSRYPTAVMVYFGDKTNSFEMVTGRVAWKTYGRKGHGLHKKEVCLEKMSISVYDRKSRYMGAVDAEYIDTFREQEVIAKARKAEKTKHSWETITNGHLERPIRLISGSSAYVHWLDPLAEQDPGTILAELSTDVPKSTQESWNVVTAHVFAAHRAVVLRLYDYPSAQYDLTLGQDEYAGAT